MAHAIDLLIKDHENVRSLLSKLTETTNRAEKTRTELLAKIELELSAHTAIEEEIFYPAFRDAGGKDYDKLYFEAIEEHRTAEDLVLPDLKKTDVTSDEFAGRAKVLKELVEHHAREEEEEMFKMAAQAMPDEQLEELGQKMETRKKELL